jgi:hypothetical protein
MNEGGDREQAAFELAAQLLFKLEKHGSGYSLSRDVDVKTPVRHDNLTLPEVEEMLETWKMRGFHGG